MSDALRVLIAAGVGGWIVAAARTIYDRGAERRSRMLDSADLFVQGFSVALARIREAKKVYLANATGSLVTGEAADRAIAAVETVRERVARVTLLFGPDSPSAEAALKAMTGLSAALDDVRSDTAWSNADHQREHEKRYDVAYKALGPFNEATLRQIRLGYVARFEWLRPMMAYMLSGIVLGIIVAIGVALLAFYRPSSDKQFTATAWRSSGTCSTSRTQMLNDLTKHLLHQHLATLRVQGLLGQPDQASHSGQLTHWTYLAAKGDACQQLVLEFGRAGLRTWYVKLS